MKKLFFIAAFSWLVLFAGPVTAAPGYIAPEVIGIPSGEFSMGSDRRFPLPNSVIDEGPVHKVYLDAYAIGKYEVTNQEYRKFVRETTAPKPPFMDNPKFSGNRKPVVGVSWHDAAAYAAWLSRKTGRHYRLPTEAEWEKAAKGTSSRKYPWGEEDPFVNGVYKANYNPWGTVDDRFPFTGPVGSFENGKSFYGLYDMGGNAREWCSDWYGTGYYASSPEKNPTGPVKGRYKVVRGGAWDYDDLSLRCANRFAIDPGERDWFTTFRLVLVK
ncbi:MAG: formylglycine-generating enzyme family protein [bacterium]